MAIKLNLKDICHECPNFEVEVKDEREKYVSQDGFSIKNIYFGDIWITCKHKKQCDAIEDYVMQCHDKFTI